MSSANSPIISDPTPYVPRPASWWERHMVPRLIRYGCSQPQVMKARSRVVPKAQGHVFELGCGGGINMEFYDPTRIASFSGLDPSLELLEFTRAKAQEHGIAGDIRAGIGEALPYADASFDTVVATFTLCSVDSQMQVLSELRRVLKPGGKALFLEHGKAPDADVYGWQRRVEPLWKRMAGNCHITRDITSAYQRAGFTITETDGGYTPKSPRIAGWMEWGEARL